LQIAWIGYTEIEAVAPLRQRQDTMLVGQFGINHTNRHQSMIEGIQVKKWQPIGNRRKGSNLGWAETFGTDEMDDDTFPGRLGLGLQSLALVLGQQPLLHQSPTQASQITGNVCRHKNSLSHINSGICG
jgi:hypothetical protein